MKVLKNLVNSSDDFRDSIFRTREIQQLIYLKGFARHERSLNVCSATPFSYGSGRYGWLS